jgi:hypothetical protein
VLAPLVLLHGLLAVELLVADVAGEGPVITVSSLVNLPQQQRISKKNSIESRHRICSETDRQIH